MKELDEIRQPYATTLGKFFTDSLAFFSEVETSPTEYYQALIDYYKGDCQKDPFPANKFDYLSQLQPCLDSLNALTHKWKLRAPWAVITLSLFDLSKLLDMPDEIDIPLEGLESIYPWAAPLPPLEIKIPAWAIILFGREAIQDEVTEKLKEYEGDIKGKGLREYPSALNMHARWWFEHYLHHKTYDEIAQDEVYTLGGSLISYAKNVGAAVRTFSRLIGIDPKVLR